ncbi:MAG: nucleotidyltransferase family protein [Pirellulales bacterium]
MSPVLTSKRREILDLAQKHGAHNVRVFGSFALGQEHEASDIDFLVDLEPDRSILDQVALQQDLEVLLGCQVDVVLIGGISRYLEGSILREAIPL